MAAALLPPVLLSCRLSRRSGSSAGEGAVDREDLEPGEELLDVPVFQRGPTDDVTVRLTAVGELVERRVVAPQAERALQADRGLTDADGQPQSGDLVQVRRDRGDRSPEGQGLSGGDAR